MRAERRQRWLIATLALAGVLGAYELGALTSGRLTLLSGKLGRAYARMHDRIKPPPAPLVEAADSIQTAHVRLHLESITVPATRAGAGGGLTSVGNELLLLDHAGTVFAVRGKSLRRTQITVPDNGFDAYVVAAQSPKYAGMQHVYDEFRYNAILYYANAAEAGLVVSYTEWLAERECYVTTLARRVLPPGVRTVAAIEQTAGKWEIVYRTHPCLPLKSMSRAIEGHMAGGRMAYRGPGHILLGSGEYSWDGVYAPISYSQSKQSDYGKILDVDMAHHTAHQVSLGTRNVQGIMVDRTGNIWAVEHGPRGGDELNHIEEGENYGWPDTTLGTRYNGLPWPTQSAYGRHEGFHPPVFAWLPSIGTSNILQVNGFDPSWDGDFLVASLTARTLFRVRVENERVEFVEPIPIGERIRYAHQHTDGRIVLWTDTRHLIFVTLDKSLTGSFITKLIAGMDLDAKRAHDLNTAIEHCAECHSLETRADPARAGPSLGFAYGRAIASSDFGHYSAALRGHGGTWTADALAAFLRDPNAFASGTIMPPQNLAPQAIGDVVNVLRELRSSRE